MGSVLEFGDFGGVDSRSSPFRIPFGKSLRCQNWVRKPSGLELRRGYTNIAVPDGASGNAIHSAFFYKKHGNGGRFVIYGKGDVIYNYNVATGAASGIGGLSGYQGKWNAAFANNSLFIAASASKLWFDGTTLRDIGIREPTAAEAASVTVTYNTGTTGTWATTNFTGYQFYMAYYNPSTGHVGNRIAIGTRQTIAAANGVMVVSGLPSLAGVNTEWVKIIGRTPDKGEVPYALIDSTGSWIVVGNAATVATFTLENVNTNAELPTRNGLPPKMTKIAWCLGRAYAIDDDDPNVIRFTEAEDDSASGIFVGLPEHCWAANNRAFFPSGEEAIGIHEVDDQVWVFSRNQLAILTEFGTAFTTGGNPLVRWIGTWTGGLADHRAFIVTPRGPFWLSAEKQLLTRGEAGPTPVSDEYEAALLAQIGDAKFSTVELSYFRDPKNRIDRLYVKGEKADGSPVFVVHDFKDGGGSEFVYTNLTCSTFVRTPGQVVSMRDVNDQWKFWAGNTNGTFAQLESGDSDNGAPYVADMITVVSFGPSQPLLNGVEWHGDKNIKISVVKGLDKTITDLDAYETTYVKPEDVKSEDPTMAMWRIGAEEADLYMYVRFRLTSHDADGTLDLNVTPHIPLESYGRLYHARPDLGVGQVVGGRKK